MATSELDGLSSLLSGPGALSSGLNQGSNRAGIDQQNSASGQHSSVGAPVAPVAAFNAEPSQRSRRGRTVASGRALPHGLTMAVDATAREIQAVFQNFLRDFYVNNPEEKLYLIQIERMLSVEQTTIYVDWLHLAEFNQDLADAILEEFYRYESYLRSGVETVVREVQPPNLDERMENSNKQYYVSFYNYNRVSKIREIRSENIGQLMAISGTVTRTSEVRPELIFGTFSCQQCGQVVRDILQQFKYTTPPMCPNALCNQIKNWDLIVEQSKFVDWQKLRVQENSGEIPPGSMPRTMQVIVRNEIVEKAKPGDKCVFTGCTIVIPDVAQLTNAVQGVSKGEGRINQEYEGITGLQGMGVRDLTYKIAFLATGVQPLRTQTGDINIRAEDEGTEEQFTEEEIREVEAMSSIPRLYTRLANCIAPSIHGHEEIKRGILLMLVGGVHKKTSDAGMSLRGDINICLVGDPSTAKSQFLKFTHSLVPRSVYTSGKASSAAGLTASVARDPETGEYGIEAGALLLADNGICCIDEFDKMDPKDQVAIHEAMEQQTISIAKAGIQATLNARASILAAANPIFGRYDLTKTLKQNVNMTAPIMSRFDLFYVVVDQCDPELDYSIAKKIVGVRQNDEEVITAEFSVHQLQRYIAFARRIKPIFTEESMNLLATHYRRLRENDITGASKSSYRITVRQLESMIRLSEALARLHLKKHILPQYVNEAARLIKMSIVKVQSEELALDDIEEESNNAAEDENMIAQAENIDENQADQVAEEQASQPSEPKFRISFEQYQRVTNMMVSHLQRHESGMSRTDLENWYLLEKEREGALSNSSDLEHHAKMIRRIIKRLIDHDHVLIETMPDHVIVHPNYDLENEDAITRNARE